MWGCYSELIEKFWKVLIWKKNSEYSSLVYLIIKKKSRKKHEKWEEKNCGLNWKEKWKKYIDSEWNKGSWFKLNSDMFLLNLWKLIPHGSLIFLGFKPCILSISHPNLGHITSLRRSPFDLECTWSEQWNLEDFQAYGNGYDCEVLSWNTIAKQLRMSETLTVRWLLELFQD